MTAARMLQAAAICAVVALRLLAPLSAAAEPADAWLDDGFKLRFVVLVNETTGEDKGRIVVDLWLDLTELGIGSAADEMRVAYYDPEDGTETEVRHQVAGERSDGTASYETRIVFETMDLGAGDSQRYHVYASNPGAGRSPLFAEFRPDLIKNRASEPSYENNNYDFSGPTDVDVAADGRIFVVDRGNHRVQIFDGNGSYIRTLGKHMTPGQGNGSFYFPTGITVTDTHVLVADTGNHRIQVFDAELTYLATIGVAGVSGADASHLNNPKDVAVDGSGKVYVTDFGNHRVQVFASTASTTASLTMGVSGSPGDGNGELRSPYSVAVKHGRICVSDSSNHRIQVYGLDGSYLSTVGATGVIGDGQGEFYYPYGIDATCEGWLAVADLKNHRVQVFNETLAYSLSIGTALTPGSGNALLHDPGSVKMFGDRIYIADTHNNRVQIFSGAGSFVRTLGLRPRLADDETRFHDPRDVAVADDGTVFVVDRSNHRVQAFSGAGLGYEFTLGTAGESGEENTHLNLPYDVDVTGSLIAVADSGNNRVQFFTRDGVFLHSLAGGGGETFLSPCGVKLDEAEGRIFVADTYHDRVFAFDYGYSLLAIIEGGDPRFTLQAGSGSPAFRHPYDVEVGPDGDIYILDTDNLCVQVLDGGNYSFKRTLFEGVAWDPAGQVWVGGGQGVNQLQWPCGFDIRGSRLFIADTYNNRLIVTELDGTHVMTLGSLSGLDNEFDSPRGAGVAPDGTIFVADSNNNRIQAFGQDGAFQRLIGTTEMFVYDANHFYSPEGVCVCPDGSFLVADTKNHRVVKYGALGDYQFTIGEAASREPGSDNEHLDTPSDVAVGNDRIYVADKGNSRIQVFHASGAYEKTLYADCYGMDVGPNGRIYAADAPEHCVRVLMPDGTPVATLGIPSLSGSDASHLNFPVDVFVADDGKVYVADSMNHRIAIYNDISDGIADGAIGVSASPGQDSSRLNNPHDVVVAGSRIFVSDTNNHRIQVFDMSGAYVDTLGVTGRSARDNARFNGPHGLSVDGYGTLYVADTSNHRVVRITDVQVEMAGVETLKADAPAEEGQALLYASLAILAVVALAAIIFFAVKFRERGPTLPRGWGVVYTAKGGRSKRAYAAMERLREADGMKVLLVSRSAPHQLEESYGIEVGGMVWLSRVDCERPGVKSMSPTPLSPLLDRISTYLQEEKGDVVMLDGIELLITENDFDSVLKFLDSLMPLVSRCKGILLIPVDADAMSKKEFALLTKGMHVME